VPRGAAVVVRRAESRRPRTDGPGAFRSFHRPAPHRGGHARIRAGAVRRIAFGFHGRRPRRVAGPDGLEESPPTRAPGPGPPSARSIRMHGSDGNGRVVSTSMAEGTILLVEDEQSIASLVSLYLTNEGFTVEHVAD